jgi:hypothetical protein
LQINAYLSIEEIASLRSQCAELKRENNDAYTEMIHNLTIMLKYSKLMPHTPNTNTFYTLSYYYYYTILCGVCNTTLPIYSTSKYSFLFFVVVIISIATLLTLITYAMASNELKDEEILEQLGGIAREVVSAQPLIGEIVSPQSLLEHYKEGECSPGFIYGINYLTTKYRQMRNIRGDGNCFYR